MKNKTINERASELMSNSKIRARVQELRDNIAQELVENTAYTLAKHIEELNEIKGVAMETVKHYTHLGEIIETVPAPDLTNALRAVQLKGQVSGHYEKTLILQQFNTNIGSITNIEQLTAELPELEFEDAQI